MGKPTETKPQDNTALNVTLPDTANVQEQPTVIQPTTVESKPIASEKEIEVPAGHVMLVALNEDGTEKPGSEFFYPETSYKRFYGNPVKFKLKKSQA